MKILIENKEEFITQFEKTYSQNGWIYYDHKKILQLLAEDVEDFDVKECAILRFVSICYKEDVETGHHGDPTCQFILEKYSKIDGNVELTYSYIGTAS